MTQNTKLPAFIEMFRQENEKTNPNDRDRWMSRATFILAVVGYAVGLGNFWRFPYLTYKYGGGIWFAPYLGALFFLGIPLAIMELSLGQLF